MEELIQSKEVFVGAIAAGAALLAAFIAAIATIVGPIITTRVSRKQTVAVLRQQWIDHLRENISEFLSIINYYLVDNEIPLENDDDKKVFMRLTHLESKIQLMLNPNEDDHNKLIELIGLALVSVHDNTIPNEERITKVSDCHNQLIKLSQTTLKREWIRVKSA